MNAQAEKPGLKRSGGWMWGAALLVVAGAVVVVVILNRNPPPPENGASRQGGQTAALSADQLRQLLQRRNLAIGHLENEDYAAANQSLMHIAELLPDEQFALVNLAICRLLDFVNLNPETSQPGREAAAREAVDAAVADLLASDANTDLAHWINAKVLLKTRDRETDFDRQDQLLAEAMQAFARAAEDAPESAVYWYEQFELGQLTPSDELRDQARAALQKAYELQPGNVRVLTAQLDQQVQARDPAILDTLQVARETLVPISRTSVALQERVPKFISDASSAVEAALQAADDMQKNGQWAIARRNIIQLGHVMRPEEITKSDLRLIQPHPLEFTVYDFSPKFYDRYGPFEPESAPAINVRFAPLAQTGPLTDLSGVVDLLLIDVDLDERLDVAALRDNELIVFSRQEGGDSWSELARAQCPAGAVGMIAADLDRDANTPSGSPPPSRPAAAEAGEAQPEAEPARQEADVDFVIFGDFGLQILRNDLSGENGAQRRFTLVEDDGAAGELTSVRGAAFIDLDHDGDLDLVCGAEGGLRILASRGNLQFDDISSISQLPPSDRTWTSLTVVDWDRDVDLDVLLAGEGGPTGILENLRHAQFRWRPFNEAAGELQSAAALAALEADGRASWDAAGAGEAGVNVMLASTPRPGVNRPAQIVQVAAEPHRQITDWDYDNDGARDLLAWSTGAIAVYRGSLDGRFQKTENLLPQAPEEIADVCPGDIDGDGDEDLLIAGKSGLHLFSNDGGNQNSWINVRLIGGDDNVTGRVNHSGINSLLELKTGARYQAQVVARPHTHFGLGALRQADILRVLMTNGIPQAVMQPEANQIIWEPQVLKGSCPFLYTWDGERYAFYTDLCWAAPLGLQLAPGVLAPSRRWEYLLIEGDALAPKDGAYRLQVTEELWEAAYFDQIELIAVDHPAEVEIYSNEKVGPAEIARFKVHTVRERRYPIAARDSQGRDVLSKVCARDEDYLQAFDRRILQGLTEPHYVELDLGDLNGARSIMLFLTGWICPTDTSLNLGIAQNPDVDPPRPPYVLTVDENGQWREAISYMGFPGGKTKTIAVDLSAAFSSGDYRLRIATSAQIYWDEIFFTADEQPAEVKIQPLTIRRADLHYRGFSEMLPRDDRSPHRYNYNRVRTNQFWPPMDGAFTRYGDVRELLTAADDRMVVMSSGDEISLVIDPPADGLPPGWKRDFIMHNVGWDKDADLNTVYGQQVEPLPFNAMQSYPFADGESYPDTPQTRAYLHQYQTRRQNPAAFWRQVREFLPAH